MNTSMLKVCDYALNIWAQLLTGGTKIDNGSDKINRGNELFRKLIIMHGYVGLLSNICCSSGLAPGKNAMSLVTEFLSTSDDENIILSLGRLHR